MTTHTALRHCVETESTLRVNTLREAGLSRNLSFPVLKGMDFYGVPAQYCSEEMRITSGCSVLPIIAPTTYQSAFRSPLIDRVAAAP
jgi:hypothetical protein